MQFLCFAKTLHLSVCVCATKIFFSFLCFLLLFFKGALLACKVSLLYNNREVSREKVVGDTLSVTVLCFHCV